MVKQLLLSGYLGSLAFIATTSILTLTWMLYSWRTPRASENCGFQGDPGEPELSFSLILPARHEEAVIGSTLRGLAKLSHPNYEVIVVIGHDDPGTLKAAEEAIEWRPDLFKVVIDHNRPKTKPKALNTALPHCRGDVIGIFDAEDEVHPDLLTHVDAALRTSEASICQSGIQLMNYRESWWKMRNCLEYFFHFRSRIHYFASRGMLPLGGNTMFVLASVVRENGGWDGDCLAEDCELGMRLTAGGARSVVAYDAGLVTREETPPTLKAFIRQRTRWDQGFIQVFKRGDWRQLATPRQRLLARFVLATPFMQAGSTVLAAVSLLTLWFIDLPIALSLSTFVVLACNLVVVAVELAGFKEFCDAFDFKPRFIDYAKLALTNPLYQMLLGVAALHSIIREQRGVRNWVKTEHVGAHLVSSGRT